MSRGLALSNSVDEGVGIRFPPSSFAPASSSSSSSSSSSLQSSRFDVVRSVPAPPPLFTSTSSSSSSSASSFLSSVSRSAQSVPDRIRSLRVAFEQQWNEVTRDDDNDINRNSTSEGGSETSDPRSQSLRRFLRVVWRLLLIVPRWAHANPRSVVYVLSTICLFSLLTGHGGRRVVNIIGLLYPMYATMKALRSVNTNDDTHWLTYWLIYSIVHNADPFIDALHHFVPFFYVLKLLFYVWCFLPQTKGASLVYAWLIAPSIDRYEACIDQEIAALEGAANDIAHEQLQHVEQQIGNSVNSLLTTAVQQAANAASSVNEPSSSSSSYSSSKHQAPATQLRASYMQV